MEAKMDRLSNLIVAQKHMTTKVLAAITKQPSPNPADPPGSLAKMHRGVHRLINLLETDTNTKELVGLKQRNAITSRLPLKTNEDVEEVLGNQTNA